MVSSSDESRRVSSTNRPCTVPRWMSPARPDRQNDDSSINVTGPPMTPGDGLSPANVQALVIAHLLPDEARLLTGRMDDMPNRLATATSPYLQQHKDNPVDWWPWSPEAFAEAHSRDVPVLLSVGYAACHWCHVMAHESFEDIDTAADMNAQFVCIKVDREERPDVDAVYMDATQALTGHGGWPMTCFLTPDGEPFSCGTYYPNTPRHGMPSFRQVLDAVAKAWAERRGELTAAGARVVELLTERSALPPEQTPPDAELLEAAVASLRGDFDADHGGFGTAPKFPPSAVLEFLLRYASHESVGAMEMVEKTCTAMARGGMYDQLAGGFARYSVDERVGGAALRKDAVRQRSAAAGVCALVAGDRLAASEARRARDRRVLARRSAHRRGRIRLCARRRH